MDNKLIKEECSKNNTSIFIVVIVMIIIIALLIISKVDFNINNVKVGKISFELDKKWIEGNYNNQYYSVYNYEDSCSITIEIISNYSSDLYLNDIIDNYNIKYDIVDVNINNIDYKMVNINNNYIYTTYINNYLYVLVFDIYKNKDICNNYKDNILNSVKIYK